MKNGIKFLLMSTSVAVGILLGLTVASRISLGSVDNGFAYLNGERLFIDEPVKSLGQVQAGQEYEVAFALRNRSNRAVRVVGFSSGCGCTTVNDLPFAIPPNSSGELIVRYKPGARPAIQVTPLRVYTDDPNKPELEIELVAHLQEHPSGG